jgi:hypothetical protein
MRRDTGGTAASVRDLYLARQASTSTVTTDGTTMVHDADQTCRIGQKQAVSHGPSIRQAGLRTCNQFTIAAAR